MPASPIGRKQPFGDENNSGSNVSLAVPNLKASCFAARWIAGRVNCSLPWISGRERPRRRVLPELDNCKRGMNVNTRVLSVCPRADWQLCLPHFSACTGCGVSAVAESRDSGICWTVASVAPVPAGGATPFGSAEGMGSSGYPVDEGVHLQQQLRWTARDGQWSLPPPTLRLGVVIEFWRQLCMAS